VPVPVPSSGRRRRRRPLLAEDVVDDEIVAGLRHARDHAVEAGPGPGQDVREFVGSQPQRAFPGAHSVDRIDGHVEEGTVQDQQELLGDA